MNRSIETLDEFSESSSNSIETLIDDPVLLQVAIRFQFDETKKNFSRCVVFFSREKTFAARLCRNSTSNREIQRRTSTIRSENGIRRSQRNSRKFVEKIFRIEEKFLRTQNSTQVSRIFQVFYGKNSFSAIWSTRSKFCSKIETDSPSSTKIIEQLWRRGLKFFIENKNFSFLEARLGSLRVVRRFLGQIDGWKKQQRTRWYFIERTHRRKRFGENQTYWLKSFRIGSFSGRETFRRSN